MSDLAPLPHNKVKATGNYEGSAGTAGGRESPNILTDGGFQRPRSTSSSEGQFAIYGRLPDACGTLCMFN